MSEIDAALIHYVDTRLSESIIAQNISLHSLEIRMGSMEQYNRELLKSISSLEGKASQSSLYITMFISLIGVIISLISLFWGR
jgi:hypothetical protein